MKEKPRVLFLCTHNAARSQMAEALLRQLAGERFEVASAGLEPTEVHPLTQQVLAEGGIDTRALHAKGLGQFLGKMSVQYAIVVCGEDEWNCPHLFPFALRNLRWPFEDPLTASGTEAQRLVVFRRIRDAIESQLRSWLHDLDS